MREIVESADFTTFTIASSVYVCQDPSAERACINEWKMEDLLTLWWFTAFFFPRSLSRSTLSFPHHQRRSSYNGAVSDALWVQKSCFKCVTAEGTKDLMFKEKVVPTSSLLIRHSVKYCTTAASPSAPSPLHTPFTPQTLCTKPEQNQTWTWLEPDLT